MTCRKKQRDRCQFTGLQNHLFFCFFDTFFDIAASLKRKRTPCAKEFNRIPNQVQLLLDGKQILAGQSLFDALTATGGDVLLATNEQAAEAQELFARLEGVDIEPAAAVALASLMQCVKEGRVEKDAVVMLNITGGGIARYRREFNPVRQHPDLVFPVGADPEDVKSRVLELFK